MYKRAKQTLLRAIKKARRKSEKNRYPFFIYARGNMRTSR